MNNVKSCGRVYGIYMKGRREGTELAPLHYRDIQGQGIVGRDEVVPSLLASGSNASRIAGMPRGNFRTPGPPGSP